MYQICYEIFSVWMIKGQVDFLMQREQKALQKHYREMWMDGSLLEAYYVKTLFL